MPRVQKSSALVELTRFGSNPGALKSWLFLPSILAPKIPLVVVMHGCTQNAAGYDRGTGWTQLAEQKGFAVLFPEQQRANNANLCFNWFEPGDTRRGSGEALSIREMIGHVVESHGMDQERVFVTGLSAGGAMANVMLATYPELFAGGAIIGGLPFGVATGVGQAFERMQGRKAPDASQLKSAVAAASTHSAPWPKISVWHGTHDQTVHPGNADQIGRQWVGVHASSGTPDRQEDIKGHHRKVWLDNNGQEVVELYLIKGMGHGIPLSAQAESPLGAIGPYMLEAGISSTARIARTWNLADNQDVAAAEHAGEAISKKTAGAHGLEAMMAKALSFSKQKGAAKSAAAKPDVSQGVGKVINDALRAAGLVR